MRLEGERQVARPCGEPLWWLAVHRVGSCGESPGGICQLPLRRVGAGSITETDVECTQQVEAPDLGDGAARFPVGDEPSRLAKLGRRHRHKGEEREVPSRTTTLVL